MLELFQQLSAALAQRERNISEHAFIREPAKDIWLYALLPQQSHAESTAVLIHCCNLICHAACKLQPATTYMYECICDTSTQHCQVSLKRAVSHWKDCLKTAYTAPMEVNTQSMRSGPYQQEFFQTAASAKFCHNEYTLIILRQPRQAKSPCSVACA